MSDHKEQVQNIVIESEDTFDKYGSKIDTLIRNKKAKTDFGNAITEGKSLKAFEDTGQAFFHAQQRVVQECMKPLNLNLENNQEEKSEVTSHLTFSGRSSGGSQE